MESSTVIPPGGTWFDTLRKSFVDVPIDSSNNDAVATTEFLEAAESLTSLFSMFKASDIIGIATTAWPEADFMVAVLGSVAFTPVKSDMLGNIKKVRERQLTAPADAESLQSLVINELKTKKHTAAEGLLWLVRGLDFTAQALRHNLSHPSEELSASFRHAYTNTLKPHHSFMVKPVFSAAMSATPYKKDFYARIASDEAKGQQAMDVWLTALERRVSILKQFQQTPKAKW